MTVASPPQAGLREIYAAAWPYCLIDIVGVALVIYFPILATWFKGT
jgi:TRAP-type mannitol/chloroaromatic compound transport system permease large subunit